MSRSTWRVGGPSPNGKAALRQGMDRFLRPLKDAARERVALLEAGAMRFAGRRPTAASGMPSRIPIPTETQILLVDSEALVTRTVRVHPAGKGRLGSELRFGAHDSLDGSGHGDLDRCGPWGTGSVLRPRVQCRQTVSSDRILSRNQRQVSRERSRTLLGAPGRGSTTRSGTRVNC